MFAQVIQAKTTDAEGLRRQIERWQEEVGPRDGGWLGTTGGVAEDGTVFVMARFESEEAAQANSSRPEQDAWWNEVSKYLDDVTFINATDVDTTLAGGSDSAGFVQVMQGRVTDKARLLALEKEFMSQMSEVRPDVIGSVRAWQGDNFTEVIYFTSEEEARKGEAAMENADMPGAEDFMALTQDVTFIDLKDPWLRSP